MPQSMPEYALTRNYLELMVELPWNKSTTGEPTSESLVAVPSSVRARAGSAETPALGRLPVTFALGENDVETELLAPRSWD